MKPISVGIVGLGTVAQGTLAVLASNKEELARRIGCELQVTNVGARRDRDGIDLSGIKVSRDLMHVAKDSDIEIFVELIGGTGYALELIEAAIESGKHVVTANKALIAEFGNQLFEKAHSKGVTISFEATVAGGIPVIKALREGLSANKIQWLAGIINGTSNFILTEMRDKGRTFNDVLAEAQELGYAEADPIFDVEGVDAAHKLCILASLAFGIHLNFDAVHIQGISAIELADINYAQELGYRIKHLGIARRTNAGIEMRVHPTLIPENQLLANVHGVMNAVEIFGDAVGSTLHYGPGAGSLPTASAVIADLVDVARALTTDPKNRVPHLAFQPSEIIDSPILGISKTNCPFYVRLTVKDEVGVLAHITQILAEKNVSLESVIQKDAISGELVALILLTHSVIEEDLREALASITQASFINGKPVVIRCELLGVKR